MYKIIIILAMLLVFSTNIAYGQDAKQLVVNYYSATGGYKWDKIKILGKEQFDTPTRSKTKFLSIFPTAYYFETNLGSTLNISIITQKATWDRGISNKDTSSFVMLHTFSHPDDFMPDILLADTTIKWEYVGTSEVKNKILAEIKTINRKYQNLSLFFDTKTHFLVRYGHSYEENNPKYYPYHLDFNNYKKVDNFMFPFEIETFVNHKLISKTIISKIVVNPSVPSSIFIIPQKLIDEAEKLKKKHEEDE